MISLKRGAQTPRSMFNQYHQIMKKVKTTDEKVYRVLCDKFDQMVNENMNVKLFRDMYAAGIKYAEDITKDKFCNLCLSFGDPVNYHPYSKVWNDVKIFTEKEYDHTDKETFDEVYKEVTHYMYTIKVDNFQCTIPFGSIPFYLFRFKELSQNRGKHRIDYSMSPAYEYVPETA